MMYHRIFGLRFSGGAVVICSSIASGCELSGGLLRATVYHPIHSVADPQVNNPEVEREDKNRDNDHGGRRLNFFPAGKGDLAHFIANVRKKTSGAPRELLQPSAKALFVARNDCCFCHPSSCFPKTLSNPAVSSSNCSLIAGRGGGIRTPKFGFGDRQFNR